MKRYPLLFLLLCVGCASVDRQDHAEKLAQSSGMQRVDISASPFILTTYSRITYKGASVRIYIEGDGLAWISKQQISADPTPKKAIGLALATQDNSVNVVYIARPCQFRNLDIEQCDSGYWTNKRFSEEVVHSVNEVVGRYSGRGNGKIELVGYSGGAAVAVLIAARRDDVASLRTVAGNLDHVALNRFHKVSQMPESLNPMDVAEQLARLPQIHFVGDEDKVIPEELAETFVEQQHKGCAKVVEVRHASHETGWLEQWPDLLSKRFPCNQ